MKPYDRNKAWIAIDVGMVQSKAAVYLPEEGVKLVRTQESTEHKPLYVVPSAIVLENAEKVLAEDWHEAFTVGQRAFDKRLGMPGAYIESFKLDMSGSEGASFPDFPDLIVPWEKLVATVLLYFKQAAERQFSLSFERLVLTVPAIFAEGGYSWNIMNGASGLAGFKEAVIMPEANAAAYYAHQQLLSKQEIEDGANILVYDLGGGTFDPALIAKRGSIYRVSGDLLSKNAGFPCGGVLFDKLIKDEVFKRIPSVKEFYASSSTKWEKQMQIDCALSKFCKEEIKEALSSLSVNKIEKPNPVDFDNFSITRDEFYALLEAEISRTIDECEVLIENVGIEWGEISHIVPVGGSSNIPLVYDKLKELAVRKGAEGANICWEPVSNGVDDKVYAVVLGAVYYIQNLPVANMLSNYGKECEEAGRYGEAQFYYNQASVFGCSTGCFNLGEMFYKGIGSTVSYNQALQCYILAAVAGCSKAMYKIAMMHYCGEGVKKRNDIAKDFLEVSIGMKNEIQQGHDMFGLKDALGWIFSMKREQQRKQNKDACMAKSEHKINDHLQEMLNKGMPLSITPDGKLTENDLVSHANFILGEIIMWGWGESRNLNEAKKYYEKAAELGHSEAYIRLLDFKAN